MAKLMDRIKDLDLYFLLDISPDADDKSIKKAYRKKALSCHPDKNPDNPKAAEEFHQLSDAYEVLADASARKAYDNLLRARKANDLRTRQLDAKRRKLKDDLEAREKAARDEASFQTVLTKKTKEEKLLEEIERLRKEGSRELEREQELMRKEIDEERKRRGNQSGCSRVEEKHSSAKLKIRWKEVSNEKAYDASKLRTIFSKYGDVGEVVVLEGKRGKMNGLVEMLSKSAAANAARIETGFLDCKLKVKLIGSSECADASSETSSSSSSVSNGKFTSSLVSDNDFESLVMQKLRQEDARRKEIQRIMEEDAAEAELANKV